MAKVMLINVTHAEESRVAIVADGTLVSFEIESFNREHLKGNIYKGVVQRVHPALEAAFVDIGAERDAFLPLDEICFRNLPHPVRLGSNGERRRPRIQDILKPGDELLVQIVKEQFGSKPPTLTTFYSLPGRFLVLLPGSDEAGISRRIEGADRVRVRELIEKLEPPEGFGIIVRTVVGFDPGLADLQRDLTYLLRLWERIQQVAQTKRAPALVYREHDLVLRNIRDYFTPDIDEIYVDNEEVFERARQFLRDVMPEKEHALRLYQGDKPIFSHFNIETQIESVYKRRVPLKSGGYIVIDGTEALTAIDVNSGRATRGANQEETAFRTNLEAAVEIARQLRLRDVGGLIVIDFIDMRNPQHISEVEKAMRTAMFEDKARHEVGRISHFGLLEISRQRLRPAATATTYVTCRMCDGYGLVRTTESAALVALRKVHNRVAQGDAGSLKVSLPTDVAMYLLNQKREDLAQLERRYGTKIIVQTRDDLMPHQCEIEVKPRSEGVTPQGLRLGGLAAPVVVTVTANTTAPASSENGGVEAGTAPGAEAEQIPASAEGEKHPVSASAANEAAERGQRKRRRRGRRRGRGRLAAESLQLMVQTLAAHAGTEAVDREMPSAASGAAPEPPTARPAESSLQQGEEVATQPPAEEATDVSAATTEITHPFKIIVIPRPSETGSSSRIEVLRKEDAPGPDVQATSDDDGATAASHTTSPGKQTPALTETAAAQETSAEESSVSARASAAVDETAPGGFSGEAAQTASPASAEQGTEELQAAEQRGSRRRGSSRSRTRRAGAKQSASKSTARKKTATTKRSTTASSSTRRKTASAKSKSSARTSAGQSSTGGRKRGSKRKAATEEQTPPQNGE